MLFLIKLAPISLCPGAFWFRIAASTSFLLNGSLSLVWSRCRAVSNGVISIRCRHCKMIQCLEDNWSTLPTSTLASLDHWFLHHLVILLSQAYPFFSIYNNWEFAPASLPRHPRCDVIYSVHNLMFNSGKASCPSEEANYNLIPMPLHFVLTLELRISHFCDVRGQALSAQSQFATKYPSRAYCAKLESAI